MSLSKKVCKPCSGDVPVLSPLEIEAYMKELVDWQLVDHVKIKKVIKFKDFQGPMKLANEIAELAESIGHHPDLKIVWGELVIEIWTHKINGLSESDFVLAAKIDQLL